MIVFGRKRKTVNSFEDSENQRVEWESFGSQQPNLNKSSPLLTVKIYLFRNLADRRPKSDHLLPTSSHITCMNFLILDLYFP